MTTTLHCAFILSLLPGIVGLQNSQQSRVDVFQQVGSIIGKAGQVNADGSYRINLPRTDVTFQNANGMVIPADMGLATYIAFNGTAEEALAVGDVAMLEHEIDSVIDTLREGNIEVVALHNHMTVEEPRLFFAHFQGTGTADSLARTFRKATNILGKLKPRPKITAKPGKVALDEEGLTKLFNQQPQKFPSGVLRFATPRKDLSIALEKSKFLPGMGLGSWVTFHACECGMTMAMGDTCCLKSELQGAIDALRKAGVHITAIHNHILGGSQEVSFLHYEGEGDLLKLANGVRNCWKVLGATPLR